MITLKTTRYKQKELVALSDILHSAQHTFYNIYCTGQTCKKCEYRRVCKDIGSAFGHVLDLRILKE